VPAEMVTLPVTHRSSTVGVRSLFVELSSSLMGLVWHFSFGSICELRESQLSLTDQYEPDRYLSLSQNRLFLFF
jgi:hypothetical protein